MPSIKSVCVFCGSSTGNNPAYKQSAEDTAKALVKNGIRLVYGGGDRGLMGTVAKVVHESGGKVFGVIPEALADLEGLFHVGEHRLVKDMHTRKHIMSEECDAFIALPGGFGTFEELFEMVTWGQLKIHSKPIGILNIAGFYDPLIALVDKAVEEGFIREASRGLLIVKDNVADLLAAIEEYEVPNGAQYELDWKTAKAIS